MGKSLNMILMPIFEINFLPKNRGIIVLLTFGFSMSHFLTPLNPPCLGGENPIFQQGESIGTPWEMSSSITGVIWEVGEESELKIGKGEEGKE